LNFFLNHYLIRNYILVFYFSCVIQIQSWLVILVFYFSCVIQSWLVIAPTKKGARWMEVDKFSVSPK
jgi:hypothetical protein